MDDSYILSDSDRQVLDVIWRLGPIARVDITPLTRLSTMSVTRITRELTDQGLLTEDVRRAGGRGQPARPLMVRADAAYAAGVYFSTGLVQVGLINLAGVLLGEAQVRTDIETPADVARLALTHIERLCAEQGVESARLTGMGFALPGDFIRDRRSLNAHALFPAFRGDDIGAELQAHLPCPVFIENDAASAALGERLMGIGQTIDDFFFAHIGHGIGGGLILGGRLYRGVNGNAGLIGVQFPNDRPRPSGQDLLESLRVGGVAAKDFSDLDNLRPQTCAPLRTWINRAAAQLREGLWITARMLDPRAVIIGGRLPHHILQEIVVRIDDEQFCNEGVMLPRPRVIASSLGAQAGLIGAAALPFYSRFFGVS